MAHAIVEKDVNFYDSKILNVCANDDFQNLVTKYNNGAKRKNTALQEVGQELLYSTLVSVEEMLSVSDYDISPELAATSNSGYHISWAVFNHLNSKFFLYNIKFSAFHDWNQGLQDYYSYKKCEDCKYDFYLNLSSSTF